MSRHDIWAEDGSDEYGHCATIHIHVDGVGVYVDLPPGHEIDPFDLQYSTGDGAKTIPWRETT